MAASSSNSATQQPSGLSASSKSLVPTNNAHLVFDTQKMTKLVQDAQQAYEAFYNTLYMHFSHGASGQKVATDLVAEMKKLVTTDDSKREINFREMLYKIGDVLLQAKKVSAHSFAAFLLEELKKAEYKLVRDFLRVDQFFSRKIDYHDEKKKSERNTALAKLRGLMPRAPRTTTWFDNAKANAVNIVIMMLDHRSLLCLMSLNRATYQSIFHPRNRYAIQVNEEEMDKGDPFVPFYIMRVHHLFKVTAPQAKEDKRLSPDRLTDMAKRLLIHALSLTEEKDYADAMVNSLLLEAHTGIEPADGDGYQRIHIVLKYKYGNENERGYLTQAGKACQNFYPATVPRYDSHNCKYRGFRLSLRLDAVLTQILPVMTASQARPSQQNNDLLLEIGAAGRPTLRC